MSEKSFSKRVKPKEIEEDVRDYFATRKSNFAILRVDIVHDAEDHENKILVNGVSNGKMCNVVINNVELKEIYNSIHTEDKADRINIFDKKISINLIRNETYVPFKSF